MNDTAPSTSGSTAGVHKSRKRLIGIDAARGLALIGLMAVHLLPSEVGDTGEPTLSWTLFSGDSAALFALLAGVGLALASGGSTPHRGREMTGDRVGLVVRAVIIGILALAIAQLMPWDPPVNSILLYYAVFFLLAIPFLHLKPLALFLSAAAFALLSPLLMQNLYAVLPESSAWNHTLGTLFTEPVAVASELLLTGSYPALTYMSFLLVGLGLGRLDLRSTPVQAVIAGVGAAMAVLANLVSAVLLYAFGGYEALVATEDMTMESVDRALVFGPETIYNTSIWWHAIATPHSGTTLAIASSVGISMMVLGVFLLIGSRIGRWLAPLAAMGAMTLTLYSAHLLALIPEIHYDQPALWFVVHLGVAAVFAWFWRRSFGRGPLETVVSRAVRGVKIAVGGSGRIDVHGALGTVEGGGAAGSSGDSQSGTAGSPPSSSKDR